MSRVPHVQTACRDCKRCTNSAVADVGRRVGRSTAKWSTLGLSELGFAMSKSCDMCGHQMSLHAVAASPPSPMPPAPAAWSPPPPPAWAPPAAPPQTWAPPAGPPPAWAPPPPPPTGADTGPDGGEMLAQLERLAALRTAGALTDAEFAAAKAKLLT